MAAKKALKAKMKVYSVRPVEGGPVVYGARVIEPAKEDKTDFGATNIWGELQINASPDSDAADALKVGDEFFITIEKVEAKEVKEETPPAK